MKITFLGTGTSQGIPVIGCECETCLSDNSQDRRLRTACMVEKDGRRIVIDVGPDFRQQMLSAGGKRIEGVLITHEHNDHVAGLDDVRPFNFKYEMDMPVYGLPRVIKHLEQRYSYIFAKDPYPGVPVVKLIPIEGSEHILLGGMEVIPIHIIHGKLPILGYRIGDFAYLTDVKTIPEKEMKKLDHLDVLVLSALRDKPHHSHLTLDEAKALAAHIGAKKTYFTHFSHWLGPVERFKSRLPANVFPAYDGLVVDC